MRIEYIEQARMPTERAHGAQIAHMCNAYTKLGHTVTLVVPRRRNSISESIFSYYGINDSFSVTYLSSIDLVSAWGKYGAWVQWLHITLLLVRLLWYVPQKGSVVYTRSSEIAWLFCLRGFPVICEVHDWPKSFSSLFAFFLRRATLLVCNSPGTERACKMHGLTQTVVAHNGIDLEEFSKVFHKKEVREELGLPSDKKIVMYIGALEKWKGATTLCEVSLLLGDGIQVVIMGGQEREVQELRTQYPRVHFLGMRPYKELAKNQSVADVLVVPNLPENEESMEYTSPIKLFAHMASGIPVVVSDLPSLRAIVNEENAFFFKAGNAESLAKTVADIFATPDDAQMRAESAKRVVQHYSWTARGEKCIRVFEALWSQKR